MGLQVTIDNDGVLEAIGDYVAKQGINTADKDLTVTIKAGRGDNGTTASVEINDLPRDTAKPINRGGSDKPIFGGDAASADG